MSVPPALHLALALSLGTLGALFDGDSASSFGPAAQASSFAWADVDNDGHRDALVVAADGSVRLLRGLADGTFEDATARHGLDRVSGVIGAAWADFDADGDSDLFLGSALAPSRLLQNTGDALVDADVAVDLPTGVRAAHWLDYDGDEALDLLLHTAAGDLLLRNELASSGSFAALALTSTSAGTGSTVVLAPSASVSGRAIDTAGRPGSDDSVETVVVSDDADHVLVPKAGSGPLAISGFNCSATLKDAATGACLTASSTPQLGSLYPLSESLNVDPVTGGVNIGTTTSADPGSALYVGGLVTFALGAAQDPPTQAMVRHTFPGGGTGTIWTTLNGQNWNFIAHDNFIQWSASAGGTTAATRMHMDTIGRVGLGTSTPQTDLHVRKAGAARIWLEADTNNDLSEADHAAVIFSQDGNLTRARVGWDGGTNDFRVFTETTATPLVLGTNNTEHLRITDGGLVSVKQTLEIRGGADIVENFESSCGELEPGTVVVIDPANPGALTCSESAYDTKVAGVVSGAGGVRPGLSLGQDGVFEGDTPVAMNGRVYVRCTAEGGAIEPGDRLTTADLPGYAMRVADPNRADGAVIGKAMSSLEEGTGLVLVLVNLQ